MNKKTTTKHHVDLDILFPFFFIVNADLVITNAGPALKKLFHSIEGKSFTSFFQINTAKSISFSSIVKNLKTSPFLIEVFKDQTILKGQFTYLSETNELLFTGNPKITSTQSLEDMGLQISDFAASDTLSDTLQLLNHKEEEHVKLFAENQFNQSDLLQKIIDLVPQQIFLKDSHSRFLMVNKRMAELFGTKVSEIIGKTDQDFWPTVEEVTSYNSTDKIVIESGATIEIPEEPQTQKDGKICINRVVKMPYIMENGDRCVLGIAIDITDIKEAQKQLQSYNETLESQISKRTKEIAHKNKELIIYNKQLEEYAFTVSHHLRAPVARLLGLTHIFKLEASKDNHNNVIINKIVKVTDSLNEIIRDLNNVIYIKKEVNILSQLHLSNIIERQANIFSNELKETGASLQIELENDGIFYSNETYLENILSALINNSIKFRSQTRNLKIKIKAAIHENFVSFAVIDNGIGFDISKVKNKIFGFYERFNTHAEGKGLGLYKAKVQIEALGGNIDVTSSVNKGTTFTIKLFSKTALDHNSNPEKKNIETYTPIGIPVTI